MSSADLHGEAGVSMRTLETEAVAAAEDETPAARWHGIAAEPGAMPHADVDDDSPDVPRALRKYLLDDEEDIIAVQLSQALLLTPAVATIGGLLLAIIINGWLYSVGKAAPGLVYTVWILWLAAFSWAAYRWVEWRQTWFVVTGHRVFLLQAHRVIGRRVVQLEIDKMRAVKFVQTATGRAFRYGSLDFASIGTEGALDVVNFLPYPEWLYREISALKMPDTERRAMTRRTPGKGK